MAMTVKKDNNEVRIQWRVADIKIPTSEIKNITQDQDHYSNTSFKYFVNTS
jgi:hypothetical protein